MVVCTLIGKVERAEIRLVGARTYPLLSDPDLAGFT